MSRFKKNVPHGLTLAVALAAGFLAATARYEAAPARAGVRKSAPREAFLSGSERSVPILMEISTTLKRIDERLARMEKAWNARDNRN